MKSRDFCYWLQGFFELYGAGPKRHDDMALNGYQVEMIKRHLALVFQHDIDSQYGDATRQEAASQVHSGTTDFRIKC